MLRCNRSIVSIYCYSPFLWNGDIMPKYIKQSGATRWTPAFIGRSSGMSVSIRSFKVQFVINEDSILHKVGKFSFVGLKIRPQCQTLSKVCATSRKAVVVYSLLSNTFNIILEVRRSWWYVEWLGLKPNWWSGIIFRRGFILWSRSRFRS